MELVHSVRSTGQLVNSYDKIECVANQASPFSYKSSIYIHIILTI